MDLETYTIADHRPAMSGNPVFDAGSYFEEEEIMTHTEQAPDATRTAPETNHYRVRWEIDVEASSPEEAARNARAIQLRADSIADVFQVRRMDGPAVSDVHEDVDLSEIDGRYVDAA